MSQIQEVTTLVLVSILLGTSIPTANADEYVLGEDSAFDLTPADQANLVSLKQKFAMVSKDAYSFTMTLPDRANSRFAKLSFSFTKLDRASTIVPVNLDLSATTAFIGSNSKGGTIGVKNTFIDETGTVWVEFDAPLSAKTLLTVVLKPQTPLAAGQYAFSIAAYPTLSTPIFVSDGTITITQ